jgi:UDP-GlcNAc:undecaprenyl-phosphate GlcNAc-1-phosphate transferase
MGHSHLHAVLILYSWTFVASVGVLAFTFVPWRWAALLFVAGLAICAAITLAPLSRRKAREAAAQRHGDMPETPTDDARYDGLDAASTDTSPTPHMKEPTV